MTSLDHSSHRICGCTPLGEPPLDVVQSRLSEAYALLSVIEVCADSAAEFGLINKNILVQAFTGIQHLIAEAHYASRQLEGEPEAGR